MSRSIGSINAEISTLEAYLISSASLNASVGSDSTSLSYADRQKLELRLDKLYNQLGRLDGSSPMFVRGVVRGKGFR